MSHRDRRRRVSDNTVVLTQNAFDCIPLDYDADDILCDTGDDYYASAEERTTRLNQAGQRYLNGMDIFLLTASLQGPFEEESGWVNPWQSRPKRAARAKPRLVHSASYPPSVRDLAKNESTEKVTTEAAAETQDSMICHLPSPESLSSGPGAPKSSSQNSYLSSTGRRRVKNWAIELPDNKPGRDEFWMADHDELMARKQKRKATESTWLKRRQSKRRRHVDDSFDQDELSSIATVSSPTQRYGSGRTYTPSPSPPNLCSRQRPFQRSASSPMLRRQRTMSFRGQLDSEDELSNDIAHSMPAPRATPSPRQAARATCIETVHTSVLGAPELTDAVDAEDLHLHSPKNLDEIMKESTEATPTKDNHQIDAIMVDSENPGAEDSSETQQDSGLLFRARTRRQTTTGAATMTDISIHSSAHRDAPEQTIQDTPSSSGPSRVSATEVPSVAVEIIQQVTEEIDIGDASIGQSTQSSPSSLVIGDDTTLVECPSGQWQGQSNLGSAFGQNGEMHTNAPKRSPSPAVDLVKGVEASSQRERGSDIQGSNGTPAKLVHDSYGEDHDKEPSGAVNTEVRASISYNSPKGSPRSTLSLHNPAVQLNGHPPLHSPSVGAPLPSHPASPPPPTPSPSPTGSLLHTSTESQLLAAGSPASASLPPVSVVAHRSPSHSTSQGSLGPWQSLRSLSLPPENIRALFCTVEDADPDMENDSRAGLQKAGNATDPGLESSRLATQEQTPWQDESSVYHRALSARSLNTWARSTMYDPESPEFDKVQSPWDVNALNSQKLIDFDASPLKSRHGRPIISDSVAKDLAALDLAKQISWDANTPNSGMSKESFANKRDRVMALYAPPKDLPPNASQRDRIMALYASPMANIQSTKYSVFKAVTSTNGDTPAAKTPINQQHQSPAAPASDQSSISNRFTREPTPEPNAVKLQSLSDLNFFSPPAKKRAARIHTINREQGSVSTPQMAIKSTLAIAAGKSCLKKSNSVRRVSRVSFANTLDSENNTLTSSNSSNSAEFSSSEAANKTVGYPEDGGKNTRAASPPPINMGDLADSDKGRFVGHWRKVKSRASESRARFVLQKQGLPRTPSVASSPPVSGSPGMEAMANAFVNANDVNTALKVEMDALKATGSDEAFPDFMGVLKAASRMGSTPSKTMNIYDLAMSDDEGEQERVVAQHRVTEQGDSQKTGNPVDYIFDNLDEFLGGPSWDVNRALKEMGSGVEEQ